jgi:hypothetical protein
MPPYIIADSEIEMALSGLDRALKLQEKETLS